MTAHADDGSDKATEGELRELFSMDDDDGPLADIVNVCAGVWRRSYGNVWIFYPASEDEE